MNGQRLRFKAVVLWCPSLGEVLPPDMINGSGLMVWTPQPPCLYLSGEPWPYANMLAYLRLPRDNDLLALSKLGLNSPEGYCFVELILQV